MRITRVIAVSLIVVSGATGWANAQALRNSGPPAEFPPASFKGKQYVDSRGCVYVRAGIDGNVTWVPRVNRQRKLICGAQPSLSSAQRAQAAPRSPSTAGAVEITLAPQDRRPAAAAPQPVQQPAQPKQAAKPARRAQAKPSAGPAPTVFGAPVAKPTPEPAAKPATPAPRRTATAKPARQPSAGPAPTVFSGPQAKPQASRTPPASKPKAKPRRVATATATRKPSPGPAPTVFGSKPVAAPAPAVKPAPSTKPKRVRAKPAAVEQLPANTRIVRRHIDENRQNTTNLRVPRGYRAVWSDDRLNPHRAERTPVASLATNSPRVPRGYRAAWGDERLNVKRAMASPAGNAATDAIWTRQLPRQLVPATSPRQRAKAQVSARHGRSPYWTPPVAVQAAPQAKPVVRVSTRSKPAQVGALARKPRYVRVAVFGADEQARTTATALAKSGLPIRLGTLHRGTKKFRLVLAGPFASEEQARVALQRLRGAGYANARLGK